MVPRASVGWSPTTKSTKYILPGLLRENTFSTTEFLTASKRCGLRIMKIGDQTLVKIDHKPCKYQNLNHENWGSDFSQNLP